MVWVIGGLLALAGLYLFLTAPNPRAKARCVEMPHLPYAHRGLHDAAIPENSLAAFVRAAEKGYGVELDVHETKDGQLIVMHDGNLQRMCGDSRNIFDVTFSEATALRLLNTDETVPAFQDVLKALAPYQTPLIVEMKSDAPTRKELPAKLLSSMADYPGFWCVESFDPRMLRWFRRHVPGILRGQLAYDPRKIGEYHHPLFYALGADLLMNFLSRPDFISYGHDTDRNLSFRIVRCLFRPTLAAWTVRSQQDFDDLRSRYDLQIFEGFEPPLPHDMTKKRSNRHE